MGETIGNRDFKYFTWIAYLYVSVSYQFFIMNLEFVQQGKLRKTDDQYLNITHFGQDPVSYLW